MDELLKDIINMRANFSEFKSLTRNYMSYLKNVICNLQKENNMIRAEIRGLNATLRQETQSFKETRNQIKQEKQQLQNIMIKLIERQHILENQNQI